MDGIEIAKIENRKTREYMSEVISSYDIENYRSAIVMLYSVCLCDLFFKLIELRDLYSDAFADSLIRRIEDKISKDKSSSSWEKDLVDSLYKESPILDNESYALIQHLRDYRNLSAHPSMDDYSDLYSPSKEMVEAYIKDVYYAILVKPALFVKSVVDLISEDLCEKKDYILEDEESFTRYIQSKYLLRMSEAMKQKVFQAFWRFVFVLQDDNCAKNRFVNLRFLRVLYRSNKSLFLSLMSSESSRYEILDDNKIVMHAFVLLGREPDIYARLPEVSQSLIKKKVSADEFYRLLSWFTHESKEVHIDRLIRKGVDFYPNETNKASFIERCFKETDDMDHLIRYYVHIVRNAISFRDASHKIERLLLPNLNSMSKDRLEDVISCFCENAQVYGNFQFGRYCQCVWEQASGLFDKEFVLEHYPKFIIPEDLGVNTVEEFVADD